MIIVRAASKECKDTSFSSKATFSKGQCNLLCILTSATCMNIPYACERCYID